MTRMSTEERKPQIVAAALKIIAERGLAGFTTRALAREVGLAEGTIFRHFESKEDIIRAAITHLEAMLEHDQAAAKEIDPIDCLGHFFRRRIALIEENPGMVRMLFSDELARGGSDEDKARMGQVKQRALDFIMGCMADAAAAGRLREGLAPSLAALMLQGVALALLFGATRDHPSPEPDRGEALWRGIRALLFTPSSEESLDV